MAETDGEIIDRLAKRHSVSPVAVQVVMTALRNGGGPMAQFSHADFGGMSQWSPGMSMVGDMFNNQLKSKLDVLCTDIAAHLEANNVAGGLRSGSNEVSYRSMGNPRKWWPSGLGRPGAVGAQNDLRYAVFLRSAGWPSITTAPFPFYDTGNHRIFGVAQAQSSDQTLSFTSQDGLVRLADLQKVDD
jgi:hypothetical protein